MLIISSYITIGKWQFDYCADVEIIQDINTLTDTCSITLPRKHVWEGKIIGIGDDPVITRGDKVVVKLGYDGNLKTRFIGYVKEVRAGMPVKIDCEDSMFLLKQLPKEKEKHTFVFPGGNIMNLLSHVMPAGIDFKTTGDITLQEIRFNRCTPAQVLATIKDKANLSCYFRNMPVGGNDMKPVLYVGLPYWTDGRKEASFRFGFNIIDPYSLVYKRKEDIRLKVRAVSIQEDNTRVEIVVGDDDGEQRMINRYKLSAAELTKAANAELEKFKYTGYHGDFETFGEPAIDRNDIVALTGNKYHPSGKYLVNKVVIKSGTGGYRQIISPGPIANDTANITSAPE